MITLLEAKNITKRFGGLTALSDVSLTIRKGDVGHFLTRYALSPTQAVFDARDNGKLKAGDFAPVNQWFANTFGRTSKVVPL